MTRSPELTEQIGKLGPYGKTSATAGPAVKLIAAFEDGNPFSGGAVVAARAPDGRKALRHRSFLREHGSSSELAWIRFPEGRARLACQGADEPDRRDPRRRARATTGPGSTTTPSCLRAGAR